MKFLRDPGAIRKCIAKTLEESNSLDAAVAFVGRDWADIIGTFSGRVRVICWLSSPNTNPYAVDQMMTRKNICVRQLSAMHAKVYILKGESPRCVVGSANLTGAALSEENASGQYEAAVEVSDRRRVGIVERWFGGCGAKLDRFRGKIWRRQRRPGIRRGAAGAVLRRRRRGEGRPRDRLRFFLSIGNQMRS